MSKPIAVILSIFLATTFSCSAGSSVDRGIGARDTAIQGLLGNWIGEEFEFVALEEKCVPYFEEWFFADDLPADYDSQTVLTFLTESLPKFPPELLSKMAKDQKAKQRAQAESNLGFLRSLPQQEVLRIFSNRPDEAWRIFHHDYPRYAAVVRTSPVAYSSDQTKAAIYVVWSSGSECSEGVYFYLELRDGQWQIILEEGVWVS
jgi:hypothetical protein